MVTIQENVLLAPFTVIKIGGPARFFAAVGSVEEVQEVIQFAAQKKLAFFLLGAGSNILVSDDGFPGLAVRMRDDSIRIEGETAIVGAGTMMPRLAVETVRAGLTGFEWGVGVPGTVGGSIRGNAGCFGGEMKDVVSSVNIFDVEKATSYKLQATSCNFDYRDSIFKKNPQWIIVDAIFKFKKANPAEAQNLFDAVKKKSELRVVEQPIGEKTMGSTFKGVSINNEIEMRLEHAGISGTQAKNRRGFISAGFFIEQAGLKGYRVGGAGISSKHANFIINAGTATALDVVRLITHIKDAVKEKFGIVLEEEIQYVGF
jgi:UDP-N-acetylmuramate dehydrogenase